LQKAREAAGLSQRQLSARLREVNNYIQRIESGQRDVTVTEFVRIANAIGVDPCKLLRAVIG
jgi:transcriptional regulator with XRE-family HTH domain